MKTILLLFLMTISMTALQAQTVVKSVEAAESESIDISEIDAQYDDALNANEELAVFNDRQSEFFNSYRQLITDIASHLNSNSFLFDGDTRMYTRIYFDMNGTIEHFYYSSDQAGFNKEKEQQFNSLLRPFLSEYQFAQNANQPFAQCSPVVYASSK
jgi:hypothetical protein